MSPKLPWNLRATEVRPDETHKAGPYLSAFGRSGVHSSVLLFMHVEMHHHLLTPHQFQAHLPHVKKKDYPFYSAQFFTMGMVLPHTFCHVFTLTHQIQTPKIAQNFPHPPLRSPAQFPRCTRHRPSQQNNF